VPAASVATTIPVPSSILPTALRFIVNSNAAIAVAITKTIHLACFAITGPADLFFD